MLVYAPYEKPGYVGVVDVAVLAMVALVISIGAVLYAIRTLRKDLKPHGAIRAGGDRPAMDQVSPLLLVANPGA